MPELSPLGVFGGTFDPVHVGHLRLAEEAADALGLACVRWIPAGQPRHREAPRVDAAHRLRLVELAIAGNPRFVLDPAEAESGEASYTVPTLERLRGELGPAQPLVLLLGADAYAGLAGWHRWREIFALAHVAVAHRAGLAAHASTLPAALRDEHLARSVPGDDPAALAAAPAGRVLGFAMTPLAVSATQVRELLAQGRSARYLLPQPVIDYIELHHLYRRHDGP
ncbi:nicotinate-nucleotide adenylyltransferase [Azospira restricta]|uniref:Probable nicotinate-nucleotide adenylyltransferase n=1 Tax=Azospira restricta TaxID=404405 RepID=A0A974SPI8_9RHOO|nr:nicotinate-nucleotide adenylyltransferase [Azospira restricta]QRJ64118.1 nicotinate-nucleotide adenylyltransferase [Azospira restricta]